MKLELDKKNGLFGLSLDGIIVVSCVHKRKDLAVEEFVYFNELNRRSKFSDKVLSEKEVELLIRNIYE